MTRPHISCRELFDFIYAYLANELPTEERVEFERHLGVCPSCVSYLDSYQSTMRAARAASDDEVPADTPPELISAILAARKK